MDVMIDLESLDFIPSSVILTFGAIKFDPNSMADPGDGIYLKPDVDEQFALGRTASESTIEWWGKQSAEVAEEALTPDGRISLAEFTSSLNKFLVGVDRIWAQGVVFDVGILEHLYRQLEKPIPWHFYKICDSRTIFSVMGDHRDKKAVDAHNALADCYYQATALQKCLVQYQALKEK